METKLHGFFSEKAAELFGTSIYLDIDGNEIDVTAVSTSEEYPLYKWADKKYVGIITQYIRPGRIGICRETAKNF